MIGKLDEALRFHASAINVRAERQQLLASNIANADTPHFKARDIDFASALKEAQAGRSGGSVLVRTATRHLQPPADVVEPAHVVYRTPRQSSVDGNTVDLDVERTQFANNAVHYEANLTFLSMQIRGLLSAIQG